MNKIIVKVSTCCLMAGMMFMPIHAEQTQTEGNEGNMTLKYTEGNHWVVTIPSEVSLSTGSDSESKITATEINIEPTKKLEVSVSSGISEGKATLSRTSGTAADNVTSIVSLTKNATSGISDNAVVAEFSGTKKDTTIFADKNGTLFFSKLSAKDGGTVKAGEYTGKITFLLEVK